MLIVLYCVQLCILFLGLFLPDPNWLDNVAVCLYLFPSAESRDSDADQDVGNLVEGSSWHRPESHSQVQHGPATSSHVALDDAWTKSRLVSWSVASISPMQQCSFHRSHFHTEVPVEVGVSFRADTITIWHRASCRSTKL